MKLKFITALFFANLFLFLFIGQKEAKPLNVDNDNEEKILRISRLNEDKRLLPFIILGNS
jgi:hypothetical protein